MEVFMGNLPEDLKEKTLWRLLEPIMKALDIVYYSCEKPRKKKHGFVIFAEETDGKRFLVKHGEVLQPQTPATVSQLSLATNRDHTFGSSHARTRPRPQVIPQLSLLNNRVYCKISNRPRPNQFAINHVMRDCNERKIQAEIKEDAPVSFSVLSLDCGHYAYISDELTFIGEAGLGLQSGTAKFGKRNLIIRTSCGDRHTELRIPYHQIVELVCSKDASLTLCLRSPPSIFSSLPEDPIQALMVMFTKSTLAGSVDRGPEKWRLTAFNDAHKKVVAYCLVYRLRVSSSLSDFHGATRRVQAKDLLTLSRAEVPSLAVASVALQNFNDEVLRLKERLAELMKAGSLSFRIGFLLQGLCYNGYLHPATIVQLAEALSSQYVGAKQAGTELPVSADAVKKLFTWIDFPSPEGDPKQFQVPCLLDQIRTAEEEVRQGYVLREALFHQNPNQALIHRATVTPTRITLHGPELESMNRILRKFPGHQDYFIRVQFCDEDGQDLFFSPKIDLECIYTRFKDVFTKGISIAGRAYTFLGFAHSSLRAHSAWFSAPFVANVDGKDTLWSYLNIIESLGEFDAIRSPARRAARIGQAFSETPFAVPINDNEILVCGIPDVKSEDGSRVFSDGVGTLSEGAMEVFWDYLNQNKGAPTCFQIRYAGAKGMLCLDTSLAGRQICLRDSMVKYDSRDDRDLGICDMASRPIPLVLNRQLIKIMEDMGTPEKWFLGLQEKEVARLRGVTSSVYNASNFLRTQRIGEAIRLYRLIREAYSMGIEYRSDGFLRSVVEAAVLKELRLLKHKARIPVATGVTLFGVMDETGFLGENEVYVTSETREGRYLPCPGGGPVLVTRSPALHPGDVQIVHNVAVPAGHPLEQLSNCIVFSQKGSRDLPSQLSGGDLDGDIYNIIWDQEAYPEGMRSFPPADYPRVAPRELERPVEREDMAEFFVDFMKTDYLGVIATRHMILADQLPEGTRHPNCMKLAELHSTAVDFSKTGIPVDLKELPKAEKYRPDFLAPGPIAELHDRSEISLQEYVQEDDDDEESESRRYKYYESKKILGKLYRAVDEKNIWHKDIKKAPAGGASFWEGFTAAATERCLTVAHGYFEWEHRQDQARRILHIYEDAIMSAMDDFSDHPSGPLTELEVFVGFIINKSGVQTRRQRDKSTKLHEEFDRISGLITSEMYSPEATEDNSTDYDKLELCMACVYVGRETASRPLPGRYRNSKNPRKGLQSFSVLAASVLLQELRRLEMAGPVADTAGTLV